MAHSRTIAFLHGITELLIHAVCTPHYPLFRVGEPQTDELFDGRKLADGSSPKAF